MMETPNLDAMDADDLSLFADAAQLLVRYADRKACAILYRAQGNIRLAQTFEANCDRIYARLPEWARW